MAEGGQANVDAGSSLGTDAPLLIQGCRRISSTVGLLAGSLFKILLMISRAISEIGADSGKEYWFDLIRL